MRVIVPTTLPDDMIYPSTRRVISQTTLQMLARPTESVLVEPENSSRGGA